ncbi:hypothetical protein H4S08_004697 [Coemansia sp. RSA 1365]|nr:hypothetical protein H4S08_004697 [Coemansia sp. RSA 1365]
MGGDEYEYGVVQGALKLKTGRIKKPKKKKGKDKTKQKSSKQLYKIDTSQSEHSDIKLLKEQPEPTEAEKRHEEMQTKRQRNRIERMAQRSYRERIKEFNEQLDRAPEHHDMPRVGPG